MLRFHATTLFTLLFVFGVPSKQRLSKAPVTHDTTVVEQAWVDSVFNAMTDDERLGQLFMIRANRKAIDPDFKKKAEVLIRDYHVGGICFFKGHPSHQLSLTNHYQSLSKVPMMVSIDGEWGLSMRLDSTITYPHNLMLGAIRQNTLVYDVGKQIALECNRMGINVNFAPVTDVNNNPNNPVINDRSFGENKYNVSAKSFMYMLGMQDNKVMACAKHFPGHGDTDVDSHLDLPVILHSRARLDSLELYPFKILIDQQVQSIMVAHLDIPALDNTAKNRPTTLSQKVVTDLLQKEMGFEGLIFTDGLEMKGVTKYFKAGEVEAEAILAGNDILLLPASTPAAFKTIKAYIADGRLSWERIYKSTKKILHAKYKQGLAHYQPKSIENLYEDLNSPAAKTLNRKVIAHALTLATSKDDIVPIKDLSQKIAVLSIGKKSKSTFQKTALKYGQFSYYNTGKEVSAERQKSLLSLVKNKDIVIIGVHDMSRRPSKNFGLTKSTIQLIKKISAEKKVILTIFGNPYSLKNFDNQRNVLVAYQETDDTEDLAAQAIFGAINITGQLPVTASPTFQSKQGIPIRNMQRFGFAPPEEVGIDSKKLAKIDGILAEMVRTKAAPGAQVLVARKGKIIYQKGYGYHTYKKKHPVQNNDIYDLASITKVAATTVSLMKLYDEGRFDPRQTLDAYIPAVANTNKANLITGDILSHTARLRPWIPFYKRTQVEVGKKRRGRRRKKILDKTIYHKTKSSDYSILVTSGLFMKNTYVDSIWQWIYDSELRSKGGYRYSDLGFYLFNKTIQDITQQPEEVYVKKTIYDKLQLHTTTYKPLGCFDKGCIIPTERDNYFRKKEIKGYVHDMGAAMLGGVSGHAGLFSNSYDLAVLFQMLLNKGSYGGEQVLSKEVVDLFTHRVAGETRRALGFDMKELDPTAPRRRENMSPLASDSTFGHLGFTGTCVWADPENDLIYIFLSNRTYPSAHNGKLNKLDIRPRIQSAIYEAFMK